MTKKYVYLHHHYFLRKINCLTRAQRKGREREREREREGGGGRERENYSVTVL